MARKSARKKNASPTAASPAAAPKTEQAAAPKNGAAKAERKIAPKSRARTKRTRRRAVRVAKRQTRRAPRARMSDARRQEILQIAAREGLTGAQVAKRFGISQVTYYLWRKKAGVTGGSRERQTRATSASPALLDGMEGTIRAQVRSAIQAMLPQLIEEEVASVLGKRSHS